MANMRGAGLVSFTAFIVLSQQPSSLAQSPPQDSTNDIVISSSKPETAASPAPSPGAQVSAGRSAVNFQDANAVLRIAVPKTLQNRRTAMAYTYKISYRNRNFTPLGKLIADYSAKYDVIFVEGLPYRRQIEENQKPLSPTQSADEQRRYDRTFAERSRMTVDQKRDYLRRPWNVDVPLPQLTTLFTNKVVGEDAIDGRPSIVLESKPRSDVFPSDEEDRRALHKEVKLWIDREDLVVSRIEATLVADDASMLKGTVARIDFLRKDGVWLPSHSDVQFRALNDSKTVIGETSEANDDFHRFHVDVRLLDPSEATSIPSQAQ